MKNVIKTISKLLQETISIWSRQRYIHLCIVCIHLMTQMVTITERIRVVYASVLQPIQPAVATTCNRK